MCSYSKHTLSNLNKICGQRCIIFIPGTDLASLIEESKLLVLLSKIHEKLNSSEENLVVLNRAKDVQIR